MEILLLNPPYSDAIYDYKMEFSVDYPLGLAYLAGTLEEEGVPYDVLDSNALFIGVEETVSKIIEMAPAIVGVTAATTTITIAAKVARMVKETLPETIFVVGGPHTSTVPERTMEEFPSFDYVVQGEGELLLADIFYTLSDGKTILDDKERWIPALANGGVYFRDDLGKIAHFNTLRKFAHLDDIPFPSRKKFPNELYSMSPLMSVGYSGLKVAKLAGSRGCPFKCVFCSEGKDWPQYDARTPENIFKEMKKYYDEDGARHFFFVDDTINVRKKDLFTLSNLIIESGMKIKWHCYARVHPIDDEILIAMKNSGCFGIMFGIETGDPELIKKLGKNVTVEQAENAVTKAKRHGFKVLTFFMFGLPGETKETCQNTIKFAKKINPDLAFFSMTIPFPGTDIYDQFVEGDKLPEGVTWEDFAIQKKQEDAYDGDGYDKLFTKSMDSKEIIKYYNRAHREFYLRPRYWARVIIRLMRHPKEIQYYVFLTKVFVSSYFPSFPKWAKM
jgi:anaerobic magnesium-protoporphyrin IX monomethyl ester cyclase